MSTSSRFPFKRLLAAGLLVVLGVVGCSRLDDWQRQLIFDPQTDARPWWREPPAGTEIYDLPLAGGDTVRAWFWQSPRADAPTVLYLHGARWDLNGSAFRMEAWTRMGYSVLAIDYRGFGASTARLPSERSAMQDAVAALHELARRQPDPARRFLYGHSLGGAIAIDLASQPGMPAVAGLVVESSFTSMADMMGTLKWGWLPGADLLITQPFDSIDKVAGLTLPVLFLHGTDDRVVPPAMSDALYAAAREVPANLKRLVKIEGASHSSAVRSGKPYETAVRTFIHDAGQAYGVAHG
ncbi:MAG TPA: alpha/beta fold hydrolase [Bordetella sp.]